MSGVFDGTHLANYRERTARQSMLGVATTPAKTKCCACGVMRTSATGSLNKGGQFICGQCRPVFARIADKKQATVTER